MSALAFLAAVLIVGQLGGAWEPVSDVLSPPQTGAGSVSTVPTVSPDGTPTAAPQPQACEKDSLVAHLNADGVDAYTAPRPDADVVHTFDRTTALGTPQVFLIEDEVFGEEGEPWFKAQLPIRPNGTTGFIRGDFLDVARTGYRLELERSQFELRLYDNCELLEMFKVGIGTGRTPTPLGRFYLASLLALPVKGTIYGDFAYGLSGFSDVLRAWPLGGIIGLHGTNDPSSVGRKSSHGCIRMYNRDIRKLVEILPLGTPIEITR